MTKAKKSKRLKKELQPPPGWPALMSAKMLALYLCISERAVWTLTATGELPKPTKLPGMNCTRWSREAVDEVREGWGRN